MAWPLLSSTKLWGCSLPPDTHRVHSSRARTLSPRRAADSSEQALRKDGLAENNSLDNARFSRYAILFTTFLMVSSDTLLELSAAVARAEIALHHRLDRQFPYLAAITVAMDPASREPVLCHRSFAPGSYGPPQITSQIEAIQVHHIAPQGGRPAQGRAFVSLQKTRSGDRTARLTAARSFTIHDRGE